MSESETPSTPPPPPPPAPEPESTPPPPSPGGDNQGVMIVLSYLWLLALIPLLTEKDNEQVQWHAKHGLVLMVAEVIIFIGLFVVGVLLSFAGGGCVVAILNPLLFLVFLVVHIICIIKGVNGERFLIPGVSQYADRF